MPDFHGPIQHVTIARTLWLIVVFPALAALFCAWRALARRPGGASTAALGAAGLALAASAYHAWLLAAVPPGDRFLLEHLWRMVRVGQLDASFDLALDPLASTLTILVTAAALPVFLRAAREGSARRFAWLSGFVAAMLLLVLADNFVLLLFGWGALGLCSWGVLGLGHQTGRSFLVSRLGDAALVLGVAVLYWGFGGSWSEGDYVPDLTPRFSSVEVGPALDGVSAQRAAPPTPEDDEEPAPQLPPTTGEGFVTLTSYSGAVVFMDDTRAPLRRPSGEILRAPFARFPVKGGFHSFRIHPGGGLDDFLVTHVAFGGDREIALTDFGPSVTFRNLRDQLAAHDARGVATVREALLGKRMFARFAVLPLALFFLFLGAIGKVVAAITPPPAPPRKQGGEIAVLSEASRTSRALPAGWGPGGGVIAAIAAAAYLVARVWFLVALASPLSTVVAAVGAGVALLAAMGLVALAPPAAAFLVELDRRVIDALVNGGAVMTRALAWVVGRADDDVVDGAARLLAAGTLRAGARLQRVQSGRIQTYVFVIVLGVLALAFLPYWLR